MQEALPCYNVQIPRKRIVLMAMVWIFAGAGALLVIFFVAWCCDYNDDQYRF